MKHCRLIIALLPVLASVCWGQLGQYQTKLTHITIDLTNNVTQKGLNVWAPMGGSQVCKPGTLVEGWDFTQWCIGTDKLVHEYSRKSHSWNTQTAMGGSALFLAVKTAQTIYGLGTSFGCTAPDMQVILFWSNSTGHGWKFPGHGNCFSKLAVGIDGTLYAVSMRSTAHEELWYSKDGGKTWTLWGYQWVYASLTDINRGCGVNENGAVYMISPNQTPTQVMLGNGIGAVGCMAGSEQAVVMAWTASGNVYYFDVNSNWAQVKGLVANQIVGLSKDTVLALDTAGSPHHWNYKPQGIQAAVTGTGTHCGPNSCQGSALHAGTVGYYYSTGHGISDGRPATKTVQWDLPIDGLTFQNANPMCDPHLGDPNSSECVLMSPTGGVECLQSDTLVADLPLGPGPDDLVSHDYIGFGYILDTIGPYAFGPTPVYYGVTSITTTDACAAGTIATCPGPNPYSIDVVSNNYAAAQAELQAAPLVDGPWLVETNYQYDQFGVAQCTPGTQITIPTAQGGGPGGQCD